MRRALNRIFGSAAAVLSLMMIAPASAETPSPPRPRPAVEAPTAASAEVARLPRARPPHDAPQRDAWAEEAETHFRTAAATLPPGPAVTHDIPAATPPALPSMGLPLGLPARLPRPRPMAPPQRLASVDARSAETPAPSAPLATEPEDTACLARLKALGVAFTREPAIEPDGTCSVPHPLKVTALGSGVAITPEATFNCRTAEALALWVRDVLVPDARRLLGAVPTGIVHDSTYVCRTRNNEPGAKLSEHAHANAVDVASIGLAGRATFEIGNWPPSEPEGRFQAAIRKGSCATFTTVLGPRSNASHATHLHFDMAQRRGGYRLCDMAPVDVAGSKKP